MHITFRFASPIVLKLKRFRQAGSNACYSASTVPRPHSTVLSDITPAGLADIGRHSCDSRGCRRAAAPFRGTPPLCIHQTPTCWRQASTLRVSSYGSQWTVRLKTDLDQLQGDFDLTSKDYSRPCLPLLWPRLYAEPFGLGEKRRPAMPSAPAPFGCPEKTGLSAPRPRFGFLWGKIIIAKNYFYQLGILSRLSRLYLRGDTKERGPLVLSRQEERRWNFPVPSSRRRGK